MVDAEAMYHQVLVPENQQSFLKFLWWANDNTDREPQDCNVCTFLVQHRQPAAQMMPCARQPLKMNQFLEEQQQVFFITILCR